jgi:hypothetical protein
MKSAFISVILLTATSSPAIAQTNMPTVAIIDTGIDIRKSFPDITVQHFDGRAHVQLVETSQPQLKSRHGTWITNLFLSNISNPVHVLSYRVEKDCQADICTIYAATIARAALDAERRGARVVQISSFGDMGSYTEGVLKGIADRGVHIVMSAGNEGGISRLTALGKHNRQNIHIVGGLNPSGHKLLFSARDDDGQTLKWRQGSDIQVRDPSGIRRSVQGTSYSASFVTAELVNSIYDRNMQEQPRVMLASVDIRQNASVSITNSISTQPVARIVELQPARSRAIMPDSHQSSDISLIRKWSPEPVLRKPFNDVSIQKTDMPSVAPGYSRALPPGS